MKELGDEIAEVAAQAGYAGRIDDFKTFMRTDPRFVATNKEDLLMVYRDAAKRADPQLAYLFGKLPRLTYGVRAVPGCHSAFADRSVLRARFARGGPPGLRLCEYLQA